MGLGVEVGGTTFGVPVSKALPAPDAYRDPGKFEEGSVDGVSVA